MFPVRMLCVQEGPLHDGTLSGCGTGRSGLEPMVRTLRFGCGTGPSVTELKKGKVFLVRTGTGRKVVIKRSDDPWSETSAAAIGRLAQVRTVTARPMTRDSWEGTASLPFTGPEDELLLVLPWIDAPTLASACVAFDAHDLGRLWAFDVLIDNSDRLLKGGNPFNMLVASDGSLFAIDQRLGFAMTGEVDAGRITRRRLLAAATPARCRALARSLFSDLRREAGVAVIDSGRLDRAFAQGVAAGIRTIAVLSEAAIDRVLASVGARPHVVTRGLSAILNQFREVAS